MTFESLQKSEPALLVLLFALVVLTFVADLFLPLGIAVWVIYFFPIALSYLTSRRYVPLILAALATLFIFLGFIYSPPGGNPDNARINRSLATLTFWVTAGIGYLFITNRIAIRHQEWVRAGLVGLNQRMGGEQRLEQIGDSILRFLADYLGAQVGAIYIRDGEVFHRRAAYALPAGAVIADDVRPGEGVAGEAITQRRSFVLDNVPDGYLTFGSTLGQAKPRHMLVAPASVDGQVNVIIELGFGGQGVKAAAVELLDRASQIIGVAVRSAKYRARLQELFEETQRQAEELQVQSEELRASNEELEEQSRALQESHARMEVQQADLERFNAQLEEQTQLLEAQRDDLSGAQSVLQAQARELEQTSRYKSEFVANMSHELRTPLNSLLILARLLSDNREATLTGEQVQYARTIETAGNDLLALINDILDISKIEAGRLEILPVPARIAPLMEKLRESFAPLAAQKGLSLRVDLGEGVPAMLETDTQRLEQVLRNFLSNAIKFSDAGEVALLVRRAEEGRLSFTVRDTGIGIPAEQQHIIFDAFRQADGTIDRKFGGTGLGLSISRELARLLGGAIHLESAPGQGSAFTLLLPEVYDAGQIQPQGTVGARPVISLAGTAPAALPPPPAAPLRVVEDDRASLSGDSRTILVVEDDNAFARILSDLAHELGFQCLVAQTADEGVTLARQYLPHAVILDISLPDHTGLSVLDRLKRDMRTRHIPVHVVSVSDYTQTALSFGAVSYMLKPVKREELLQALEGMERRFSQKMRRVLVVEDDARQLESLGLLLASRDVEAVGAGTAAACLEALRGQTYDCMVLDLSLPDASGFDVLDQLAADEALSFPPVIVYTGRDLSPDEELRLRRYSKSIIIKGAKSPERLLDEVTLFLHQVVAELPEDQQRLLAKSLNRDAALEGRRILVAEDDVRNVYALTSIFEPHGAHVQITRNGREALDALERATQGAGPPIDLILMDVMMPEMDGLTATREIRSRPHWKGIPIIVLTAKAMADDQEQCLAAGANDYLAKPLDVDKLLSLVRVWMPR